MRPAIITTCLLPLLAAASAADGPSVIRTSILVATRMHSVYQRGAVRDETQHSWQPRLALRLNGPIDAGSAFYVDFQQPGGKPWLTINLGTVKEAVSPTGWWNWELNEGVGGNLTDEKATLTVGEHPFRIYMKNELMGSQATLFEGTYTVKKFREYPDNQLPKFKNVYDYYVDQDWNLPMGYVLTRTFQNQYGRQVADTPRLQAVMWFRGEPGDAAAYLLYQGKQIATSGEHRNDEKSISTFSTSPYTWSRARFTFMTVLPHVIPNATTPEQFYLNKNPGDYEVRVLRGGKLTRTLKFSVGADGKLVDPGFSAQNQTGDGRILFPVQVLGDTDGKIDVTNWKKDAFYGQGAKGL